MNHNGFILSNALLTLIVVIIMTQMVVQITQIMIIQIENNNQTIKIIERKRIEQFRIYTD